MADEILQSAVLNKLTIIGEAASQISSEFRSSHSEIDWKRIIGLRNVLVHAYFGLDMNIIWTTAKSRVGTLRDQLKAYLQDDL